MKLHLFSLLLLCSRLLSAQAIIITEIFADPTPSRGLPEREFLEILNRSAAPVHLAGYTLTYGNVEAVFPSETIGPGEYRVVCRNTYAPEFSAYGRAIGLPRLSLNNTGNTLVLASPGGAETHRVSYSFAWYTPGRTEGYSLEMIDTAYPCRGKDNWASSPAAQGATPGQENAAMRAHPDTNPPELLHYDREGNRILLVFNEVLAEDFAGNPHHFELADARNGVISAAFSDTQREAVTLVLDTEISGSARLIIYAPRDCSGNEGPDLTLTLEDFPEPEPGEICLSEVLFNPPAGGDDFVEIHNPTEKRFNLRNWQLARLNAGGEITGHVRLSGTSTALPAKGWMAFTRNRVFLLAHYPRHGNIVELPALPAYNNDAGTVLLLKPDSTVFDRLVYSEKMHASLVHEPKGVSLERTSFPGDHWTSASADAGFATPGQENSQSSARTADPHFEADPPVFHPDSDAPLTWLTYRRREGEAYAVIIVADRHGRVVRTLSRNHLLGTSGRIAWDGTDDRGHFLPSGYYAFIITLFGHNLQETHYAKAAIGVR